MSEIIPETPALARPYCPGCEPDADPCKEILDVRWCDAHVSKREGLDDEVVAPGAYPSGSAEAGGEDNRRWNELLKKISDERRKSKGEEDPSK